MSGKSSMVLRDLWASVMNTDGVIDVNTSSLTDMVRAVVTESTTSTNWSTSVASYDVSGYTVSSSTDGAILTDFYCNTGVTLQVLLTGDTIIQSYVSGATLVANATGTTTGVTYILTGTTITEIITTTTGVTITPNNYLNVQVSGMTSSTGSTTGTLIATDYLYFGDATSDGSWRMDISGADLIVEKKVLGSWITKGTFVG